MPNDLFRVELVERAGLSDLEAAQRELARLQYETDPRQGLRHTLRLALGMLHRYATGIVHVDTGRLKNSIFWEDDLAPNGLVGQVATNLSYAQWEEWRGGDHAFFARTVREEGPHVNDLFAARIFGPTTRNTLMQAGTR